MHLGHSFNEDQSIKFINSLSYFDILKPRTVLAFYLAQDFVDEAINFKNLFHLHLIIANYLSIYVVS